MEAGGGGGGGSARRRSFSDNRRDPLAGLTLNAVLGNGKGPVGQPLMTRTVSRTLLDIIRDEEPNSGAYKNLENHHNNKKSWKIFRDRLRLRRAGAAWASSVHTPTSDVSFQTYRSQLSRNESTRMPLTVASNSVESAQESTHSEDVSEQGFDINNNTRSIRPQMMRRESTRISTTFVPESTPSETESDNAAYVGVETVPVSDVPIQNSRSQIMRRNSSRLPSFANRPIQSADGSFNEYDSAPSVRLSAALAAEREQIQRVVSSAEAGAAATENETEEGAAEATAGGEAEGEEPPVRMSLMDLLEETDRQMGWSSYAAEEEEEEEEEEEGGGGGGTEYTCCVCMVRHKGAAFIPCGHTFCRLCSRELWVSRGNCPLCNGFILEILDIF